MPTFREYARRLASIPGLSTDMASEYLRDPGMDWAETIDPIGRLLPTGVCDNRPLERVLRRLFSMRGRTNDFRKLAARLYIVATDLNTGHSVRFGEPGLDDVPISRAIQASTALPGLYSPVAIDGRVYADGALLRTMNASVLLDAGADFVICVNPLVAFDASSAPRPDDGYPPEEHNLVNGGLPAVLSQTFRSHDPVTHAGRHEGLQAELPACRRAACSSRTAATPGSFSRTCSATPIASNWPSTPTSAREATCCARRPHCRSCCGGTRSSFGSTY